MERSGTAAYKIVYSTIVIYQQPDQPINICDIARPYHSALIDIEKCCLAIIIVQHELDGMIVISISEMLEVGDDDGTAISQAMKEAVKNRPFVVVGFEFDTSEYKRIVASPREDEFPGCRALWINVAEAVHERFDGRYILGIPDAIPIMAIMKIIMATLSYVSVYR